ncbi:MAG: amidohydrolase family protein [Armatimonadota bacterium]|nr:amidohydrolase family protein [Armatimonadota bacterium]
MESRNYDELMEYQAGREVIDTHEHLPSERDRLASHVDFSTLFSHYCKSDLQAAGMPPAEFQAFFSADKSVDEKWRLFEPYYNLIRDGSYARAGHIAMEQFYGLSRLESVADAEAVSKAIRDANKPGLYKQVLKDACHIRISMNFGSLSDAPEFFAPVMFASNYVQPNKALIRTLEDTLDVSCGNLDNYVNALWEEFRRFKEQGMRGIKFHLAYMRDLHFAPRTHAEAESLFLRIMDESHGWPPAGLGYREMRPLEDYLVHKFMEIAGQLDVPVVFHTGLQADIDHNADNSRPLRLWNLPHRYRNVDFILLHSGFPWMEDAGLMAKHYPNVYLDLAWAHLMSPAICARHLQSWFDYVPMNKPLGFGGDYCVVEKVYGHLTLAKENIARALAAKVDDGGLSLDRAKTWIHAMLWDNPKRVYRLEV